MKFILMPTAILLFILGVSFLPAKANAQIGIRRVALLIGVEEYEKRGFSNLGYSEDDMIALDAILCRQGFETTLLLGSAEDDSKASRENIETAIASSFLPQLEELGKQDIVVVAMAGHGLSLIHI